MIPKHLKANAIKESIRAGWLYSRISYSLSRQGFLDARNAMLERGLDEIKVKGVTVTVEYLNRRIEGQ
jgi:hypothetical protein